MSSSKSKEISIPILILSLPKDRKSSNFWMMSRMKRKELMIWPLSWEGKEGKSRNSNSKSIENNK
jgi:hypothetical protein